MPRERSFKDYVADRFYNELYDGVREFIKDNPRDLDLKLYRVQDIDDIELSDIRVAFVDVHDQPETGISFDVAVDADIETIEEDKYCNEDEEAGQWFMVRCSGDLTCSLEDFQIHSISVYSGKIPQPKDYFSVCYLNKDKDSTVSFEIKYGRGFAHSTQDKQAKLVEEIVMDEMRIYRSLPNDFVAAMKIVWGWRGIEYKELAERIHLDDQTISRIVNGKRDPSINSLVLICLGMHLPPEISLRLIELSPVSLNFAKPDHIWYNFALQHLSKLAMEKIEAFFGEHNVKI